MFGFGEIIGKLYLQYCLIGTPEMSFASDEACRGFRDEIDIFRRWAGDAGIGSAANGTIKFAKNWARLMEAELEKGHPLTREVIHHCERLADVCGESGASYGIAWNLLVKYWKYGQHLLSY